MEAVQWFITFLLLNGSLITAAVNTQLNYTAQDVEEDIFASICSFRGSCNSRDFYSVFSERDGSPTNTRILLIPNVNLDEPYNIECRTRCPLDVNTTVSWCIHLLTIKYEVRLCWNDSERYVSPAASLIRVYDGRLEDVFAVNSTKFRMIQAPIVLRNSLIGCFVQSQSCNSTLYYSIAIGNNVLSQTAQRISEFPTNNGQLTLFFGETAILNCSTVTNRRLTQYFWRLSNGTLVCPVVEDPFCVPSNHTSSCGSRFLPSDSCRNDTTARGQHCKKLRVRSYSYSTVESCVYQTRRTHTTMVIDAVTWSDAGVYTCIPSSGLMNKTMNVTVELKPKFINFPENTSQVIDDGVDDAYNCTVASSNRTRVQWVFREAPIPECIYSSYNPSWNNCQTESRPCVTSRISVTEELFLVHSLILHLCNVTADASGHYTCEVQGIDDGVAKSNNLMTQQSIDIYVNVSNKQDSNTNVDDENDRIVIPLVSALASVLIIIMSIVIAMVMIKLFCYIKNPHVVCEAEDANQEIELTSTLPTKKFVEEDDWEFSREKLKLLQKIGAGNFGQVLKARAEGIVPELPHVNVVAVKQTLDAIDSDNSADYSNLWHELEIMKKIKAHPNICNLLACCTTKGGPLCIVLEYAMYGKLKDYLLECKRVAARNGCLPLRIANVATSEFHNGKKVLQAVQFSSLSSGYGSIIGKSYTDSQESIGTKDSDDNLYSSSMDTITTDGVFDIPDSKSAYQSSEDIFHTYTEENVYCNSPGLIYEEDVINFSLQIANGMEHLERLKIVHRDLAARNILIAEDFCLKICDFGMAKDTQATGCYEKLHEETVPVKWTAIEALTDKIFTHKSDVWSYGILMWEICSYGQPPFQDINIEADWTNFICHLKQGNHLDKPAGCRDFLYDKMKECWNLDPIQRPDFRDIVTSFKSFYITE